MKLVSPYRTFPPARSSQIDFDWVGALQMLRVTAAHAMRLPVHGLTDDTTAMPDPTLRYPTTEPRMMLWILEVSLAYLTSPAFDQDTVLLSPDLLLLGDLRPFFAGDLTILVRQKFWKRPILNAAQWWPVAARPRLIAFYQAALDVASTLPDEVQTWGADSESLRVLLAPITPGLHRRAGLQVSLLNAGLAMHSLTKGDCQRLERCEPPLRPRAPIVDFKYTRKRYMPAYFAALTRPAGKP